MDRTANARALFLALLLALATSTSAQDNTEGACYAVHSAKDKCAFVKETPDCEPVGYIHFTHMYYCSETPGLRALLVLLYVVLVPCFFRLLGSTADAFLRPALEELADQLNMSPGAAGTTFVAFGNGAPDVFSGIAAIRSGSYGLALGALLGGGLFITSVVMSSVVLVAGELRVLKSLLRDAGALFAAVAAAFAATLLYQPPAAVPGWLPAALLLLYGAYVAVVVAFELLRSRSLYKGNSFLVPPHVPHAYAVTPTLADAVAPTPGEEDDDEESDSAGTEGLSVIEDVDDARLLSQDPLGAAPRPSPPPLLSPAASRPSGAPPASAAVLSDESDEEEEAGDERRRLLPQRPPPAAPPPPPPPPARPSAAVLAAAGGASLEPAASSHPSSKHHRRPGRRVLKALRSCLNSGPWLGLCTLLRWAEAPFDLARRVTIPHVDFETDEWSRGLTLTAVALCPATVYLGSDNFDDMVPIGGGARVPLLLLLVLLGCLPAAALFLHTRPRPDLPRPRAVYAVVAFACAAFWVNAIAAELVGVVTFAGILLNADPALMGMTVIAWGNSMPDLVTDVTLARRGHTRMACAACYGGPFFNLCVGLGVGLLFYRFSAGGMPVAQSDRVLAVTFGAVLTSVAVAAAAAAAGKGRLTWRFSALLFAVYGASLAACVAVREAR